MLRNESVQLTIAEGRITSLVDVQLGYVTIIFTSDGTVADVLYVVVNLLPRALLVASSCLMTGLTTGMHGVRIA